MPKPLKPAPTLPIGVPIMPGEEALAKAMFAVEAQELEQRLASRKAIEANFHGAREAARKAIAAYPSEAFYEGVAEFFRLAENMSLGIETEIDQPVSVHASIPQGIKPN